VGNISTWITAALRNEQFFSLAELNRTIREKLELFNQRLFQKKDGSRASLFLEEEKPLLAPLPATRYELSDWKQATVQRESSRTLVVREAELSHIHRQNAIFSTI
jgi:hypothetical protein